METNPTRTRKTQADSSAALTELHDDYQHGADALLAGIPARNFEILLSTLQQVIDRLR